MGLEPKTYIFIFSSNGLKQVRKMNPPVLQAGGPI